MSEKLIGGGQHRCGKCGEIVFGSVQCGCSMSESTRKKDYCNRCMSNSLLYKDDGQVVCNNCGKCIVAIIKKEVRNESNTGIQSA